MLDFRKVLLALSVAGLGLVGTASAQVPQCPVNAQNEGYVAADGTTELLPAFVIGPCTGPAPTGAVTFSLTSSVLITNQTLKNGNIDVAATDGVGDLTSSVTQSGPNTIQIVFGTLSADQTITVTGIRVNASLAPISSNITVGASAVGVAVTGSAQPLGFVTKALSSVTTTSAVAQSLCTAPTVPPSVYLVSTINITNGFPDSLRSPNDVWANSTAQTLANTSGTRLAVTFNNLNAGVNYYVPGSVGPGVTNGLGATGTLALSAYAGPTGSTLATLTTAANAPGAGFVVVTSASPTVWYGVTASNAAGTTTITFNLTENIPSAAGVTSTSTSAVTASVVLVGPASPAYPGEAGAPVYASTATANPPGTGLLNACSTTLLFPYVINVAGFDTGLAIANASTGVASTGVTPSSGSCNVTFYGTGAPTTQPYSTGTIATATVTPFDVGTVAPGFAGYAIAVCNFQGAHGYAFVSDGLGTGTGIASNYLAVVLADNGNATPAVTAF